MIDETNILNSGILERYLTGDLSQEEEQSVEALLECDASLRAHVHTLETSLENMAQENAVVPPQFVKERLFKTLSSKENATPIRKNITTLFMAIAAILTILFGSLAFWYYGETQKLKTEIDLVNNNNENLQRSIESLEITLGDISNKYATLTNPNTEKYVLKGNPSLPDAVAIAYLNPIEKTAFVSTVGMPELPQNKDYQMWADVNGEMINMGVLKSAEKLMAVQFIENATSINITIEPKGGSDHATVENLVANQYVLP